MAAPGAGELRPTRSACFVLRLPSDDDSAAGILRPHDTHHRAEVALSDACQWPECQERAVPGESGPRRRSVEPTAARLGASTVACGLAIGHAGGRLQRGAVHPAPQFEREVGPKQSFD